MAPPVIVDGGVAVVVGQALPHKDIPTSYRYGLLQLCAFMLALGSASLQATQHMLRHSLLS
jgi:hypothetical protein